MSSSKNQSSIMIGIGLMVIAIVIIIYSLNLPKVADISESATTQTSASSVLQTTVSSADASSNNKEVLTSTAENKTENARKTVTKTTNSVFETVTNTTTKITGNAAQSQKVLTGGVSSSTVAAAVSYPINLNTCTAEELMSIENVGESRANAIIEYRDYLGGYTSVEQLKDIKGIGDATFAKIEPYVTV